MRKRLDQNRQPHGFLKPPGLCLHLSFVHPSLIETGLNNTGLLDFGVDAPAARHML